MEAASRVTRSAEAKDQPLPPRHPPNPNLPYREDCWSEGATATLIEAWGDRYVDLNRGNLRQKQWQEVADAVNSRRTAVKRPVRTDIQCKNRIDTLKKKYKIEKSRIAEAGGTATCRWQFYSRLEELIGPYASPSAVAAPKKATRSSPSPPPPVALPLPYRKNSPLPPPAAIASGPKLLRKGSFSAAAAAAAAAAKEDDDEMDSYSSRSSTERPVKRGFDMMNGGVGGGVGGRDAGQGDGVMELAHAILKFGEIYERVESAKLKQMVDLEKERIAFNKEIEFQRLQMFVDSQVQLQKMKRSKNGAASSSAVMLSLGMNGLF